MMDIWDEKMRWRLTSRVSEVADSSVAFLPDPARVRHSAHVVPSSAKNDLMSGRLYRSRVRCAG
eukprot:19065-Eustigmatos_ZCMA.PRE.1